MDNISQMKHMQWDWESLQGLFWFDFNRNLGEDNIDACFDLSHKKNKSRLWAEIGVKPQRQSWGFQLGLIMSIVWGVASCSVAICSWISDVSAWCSAAPTQYSPIRPFDGYVRERGSLLVAWTSGAA